MDAKTVKEFFGYLTDEQCQLVADLCNGEFVIDPYNVEDQFPKTQSWVNQCHNPPSQNELIMAALDDVLDGHGVEAIFDPDDSSNLIGTYVNQGDTYDGTIVYDVEDDTYCLSSWGDWYEGWINDQNEENGTIQCGWCSHLTPHDEDTEWNDVICEQCGNYVDGRDGP